MQNIADVLWSASRLELTILHSQTETQMIATISYHNRIVDFKYALRSASLKPQTRNRTSHNHIKLT